MLVVLGKLCLGKEVEMSSWLFDDDMNGNLFADSNHDRSMDFSGESFTDSDVGLTGGTSNSVSFGNANDCSHSGDSCFHENHSHTVQPNADSQAQNNQVSFGSWKKECHKLYCECKEFEEGIFDRDMCRNCHHHRERHW